MEQNPLNASWLTLMCLPTSDLHDPVTSHLLLLECELCFEWDISIVQCIRSTNDRGGPVTGTGKRMCTSKVSKVSTNCLSDY